MQLKLQAGAEEVLDPFVGALLMNISYGKAQWAADGILL
jgi:hypothetical protein